MLDSSLYLIPKVLQMIIVQCVWHYIYITWFIMCNVYGTILEASSINLRLNTCLKEWIKPTMRSGLL